jgi:hypothetical protein
MILLDVIANLDRFDEEDVIYVKEPWHTGPAAMVGPESIAREVLEAWASSLQVNLPLEEQCEKVIFYATNDAYELPWRTVDMIAGVLLLECYVLLAIGELPEDDGRRLGPPAGRIFAVDRLENPESTSWEGMRTARKLAERLGQVGLRGASERAGVMPAEFGEIDDDEKDNDECNDHHSHPAILSYCG